MSHHPFDPSRRTKVELGFKSDRFAPLLHGGEEVFTEEHLPDAVMEERELVLLK